MARVWLGLVRGCSELVEDELSKRVDVRCRPPHCQVQNRCGCDAMCSDTIPLANCATVLEWHSCANRRAYVSLLRVCCAAIHSRPAACHWDGAVANDWQLCLVPLQPTNCCEYWIFAAEHGCEMLYAITMLPRLSHPLRVACGMSFARVPRCLHSGHQPGPTHPCDAGGMGAQACIPSLHTTLACRRYDVCCETFCLSFALIAADASAPLLTLPFELLFRALRDGQISVRCRY